MPKFFTRCRHLLARIIKNLVYVLMAFFGILMVMGALFIARWQKNKTKTNKPRLVWGTAPIISLSYMSQAMKLAGFESEVIVTGSSRIYQDKQFDRFINVTYSGFCGRLLGAIATQFRAYYFLARALIKFDIFHYFFDAGILQQTVLAKKELSILKLAGKKLILMPYGGDSFVFDALPNPFYRHGLLIHYPQLGDKADLIQKTIRYRTQHADCVIACLVHYLNLPRWDILPLVYYPINLENLTPIFPQMEGAIRIAHAPNHRGIKGTEFLIQAVEQLKQEGYNIILDIIENKPNHEALYIISRADILVDQLIFGYALAAIEGLALGKIVISGLQDTPEYELFRHYSYLNECPIVPASITTIYEVLKNLIAQRDRWQIIGKKSREFVERRHSFKACTDMFEAIYEKIWYGKEIDLINFYHPLLSKTQGVREEKQLSTDTACKCN